MGPPLPTSTKENDMGECIEAEKELSFEEDQVLYSKLNQAREHYEQAQKALEEHDTAWNRLYDTMEKCKSELKVAIVAAHGRGMVNEHINQIDRDRDSREFWRSVTDARNGNAVQETSGFVQTLQASTEG